MLPAIPATQFITSVDYDTSSGRLGGVLGWVSSSSNGSGFSIGIITAANEDRLGRVASSKTICDWASASLLVITGVAAGSGTISGGVWAGGWVSTRTGSTSLGDVNGLVTAPGSTVGLIITGSSGLVCVNTGGTTV